MAPTGRKLFSEPVAPDPCLISCDPTRNALGFCPPSCVPLCPALCRPFPNLLPPSQAQASPSVQASGGGSLQSLHNRESPLLIAMIVLLGSAFLLAVSYFIYSFLFTSRRQRRGRLPELDHSVDVVNYHPVWYITTVGLPPSAIESIAVFEYKKDAGLMQGTGCSVCLAEFEDGDSLRLLPKCCHAFHVPCIDTWLASRTTCPVCRAPVVCPTGDARPGEARFAENGGGSTSGEEESAGVGEGDAGEEGEMRRPVRRAASMDSLFVEFDRKLNSSSPRAARGSSSLAERSLSCTGKLLSSSRGGLS